MEEAFQIPGTAICMGLLQLFGCQHLAGIAYCLQVADLDIACKRLHLADQGLGVRFLS
ncbi:MAG: hypothetical protein RQ722_12325 [Desulfuromonadales bacterium]|nr:hypothetical protein [Desulfuromonadales bacterium]